MRTAKELLVASKAFASESRARSWWYLWSTLVVLTIFIALTTSSLPLVVRLIASCMAGLAAVRLFIIYHDFQHGAILCDSSFARRLMSILGLIMLNPASVWNRSHEHHHKNNSKAFGANIGSYPVMTIEAFATASRRERLAYVIARHPMTMLLGYFSVFLWGMCLRPFLLNPRRHFDGGLAVLVNLLLTFWLLQFGWDCALLSLHVPLMVASALGSYLFYAQHNFPSAQLSPRAEWSHVQAALHSSSYISMGPLMAWFTGNIGYHHVHHLNARIPFYRLPEAMDSLPELQAPGMTTLQPRDIAACLRLKLWSVEKEKFVGFDGQ